jgi:clan AA aspartic protease (TIGR02281 family)
MSYTQKRPKPLQGFLLAAVLLIMAANAALAEAGPLERGIQLYQKRDFRGALGQFSAALASDNSPTVLYYAALCYQQLGDLPHAKHYFELVCSNYAASKEAALAAQGLKQLESPAIVIPPNATVSVATAGTKLSDENAKMPSATASATDVSKYMSDYKLTDAEWKALPDQVKVPFFRGTSSHLFVNGAINGRSVRMMFDTGAEICVFGKSDIEGAGAKVDLTGPTILLRGVAGLEKSNLTLAQISVGDLKRTIPIVITDHSVGFAVLGQTFFKEFRYNIDNGSGFIEFTKKPRGGVKARSFESTDLVKIPYSPAGNNMIVEAKINGQKFPMMFDTGAYAICLSILHARALRLQIPEDAQSIVSSGAGGAIPGVRFYLDRLELGPIIKTHVPVVVNMGFTPATPLLGQPFFADRKFTIDTENHTINFSH